jgi:hypothetical protein
VSIIRSCLIFFVVAILPTSPAAARSHAMAADCAAGLVSDNAAASRADERWLRGFGPEPGAPSLRSTSPQGGESEQVLLALRSIRSTCRQYKAGQVSEADADLWLDGYERTISNFIHDRANDTLRAAATGEVARIGQIREGMTSLVGVMRQSALSGDEKLAEESRAAMIRMATVFNEAFQKTCFEQSFDPEIAVALDRQNKILGIGIDVLPCANRRHSIVVESGIRYEFRNCSRGGEGYWRIKVTGMFSGTGSADLVLGDDRKSVAGAWKLKLTGHGATFDAVGDMKLVVHEDRAQDGTLLKRRTTAKISTSVATGRAYGKSATVSPQQSGEEPVIVSDKPCKSLED